MVGGPKIAQELAKWTQDRPQRTQVKAMLTQEKLTQAQDSSTRAQSELQAQAVSLIRAAGVVHDVDNLKSIGIQTKEVQTQQPFSHSPPCVVIARCTHAARPCTQLRVQPLIPTQQNR